MRVRGSVVLSQMVLLPIQVFGEQIMSGSEYDRPEVLDFPTYAACRFLDTAPNNPVSGNASAFHPSFAFQ